MITAFLGFLSAAYSSLSMICLLIQIVSMWKGWMEVNAWNLTMFLWMPLVILFVVCVVILPILIVVAALKILF